MKLKVQTLDAKAKGDIDLNDAVLFTALTDGKFAAVIRKKSNVAKVQIAKIRNTISQRLLKYLMKKDIQGYRNLIEKLGIRK